MASGAMRGAGEGRPLRRSTKAVYGLGDHTVNLALSALSFIFPFFLVEIAGVRAGLVGLIPLIGRAVDAVSDPLMGRLSDVTRWRWGRRRPYLLIGMLPFGASFAALWVAVDGEASDMARFAYYAGAYVVFSLASTVLAVPYLALIPELTEDYDERTSLNTWRTVMAILGTLLAVTAFRPVADGFGGGPEGYAAAGILFGTWMVLPWLVVHRFTWERPSFQRPAQESFLAGLKLLWGHRTYRRLTGLYLLGRIAIDLSTSMFLLYFAWWLGRPDDFEITMGVFLVAVVAGLPIWLAASRRSEKHVIFVIGAVWWIASQVAIFLATPEWPRLAIFALAAAAAVGYAAADVMPWSMLGDVVDEDELRTGERREGIYYGTFTFLRKLGGAVAVALAFFVLELTGYVRNRAQNESTLFAIRLLTGGVPAVFIFFAACVALRYPLDRVRHLTILGALERLREERATPDADEAPRP